MDGQHLEQAVKEKYGQAATAARQGRDGGVLQHLVLLIVGPDYEQSLL